jgi:hypothetical protein
MWLLDAPSRVSGYDTTRKLCMKTDRKSQMHISCVSTATTFRYGLLPREGKPTCCLTCMCKKHICKDRANKSISLTGSACPGLLPQKVSRHPLGWGFQPPRGCPCTPQLLCEAEQRHIFTTPEGGNRLSYASAHFWGASNASGLGFDTCAFEI